MKTSSKYIALAAIAFGLAACTQEEEFAPQQSDIVQIATANIATEVHSRVNTLDNGENFESNDQILLVNNSRSNKNSGTYTVTFSGETTTWSLTNGMVLWSSGTETNNFTAYYPATETFTLPTDQSTEAGIKSADRMVATTSVAKGNAVALNFKRQNAKVTITSTMTSQYTGGTICEFMIGGVKPYKSDNGYTAILEPTESGFTVSLKVGSDELTATSTQKLEAGKHYTFNLTVGKAAVTLDGVNVDNWNSDTLEGGVAEEIPYLTFSSSVPQTLSLMLYTFDNDMNFIKTDTPLGNVQYSINGGEWQSLNNGQTEPFGGNNGNLRLRGKCPNGTVNFAEYEFAVIEFSDKDNDVACLGDIRTLVDYEQYYEDITDEARFCYLFSGCSSLTSAPELPATTLADYCYMGMFSGCSSLTSAPELPATTLTESCYESMFSGCSSLTLAPELPATTLAGYCYSGMFSGCSSLTSAPELSATTLAEYCYSGMFSGCSSLTLAPELPATSLQSSCYLGMFSGCSSLTSAPELPATSLQSSCYMGMFSGCTSLASAPALPATTLAASCYSAMFEGCTSLTSAPKLPVITLASYCYSKMFKGCSSLTLAPELPASTLASYCYQWMFNGCTRLNSVTMLATDISATSCLLGWLDGVAETGTFTKAAGVEIPTGTSGIPEGWTVNVPSELPSIDNGGEFDDTNQPS